MNYQCFWMMITDGGIFNFSSCSLCGVVKNVTNPGDCSSAERCILAYLYDMFTWCKLEKVSVYCTCELCHGKSCLKIFFIVIPKEGLVGRDPRNFWVSQRQRSGDGDYVPFRSQMFRWKEAVLLQMGCKLNDSKLMWPACSTISWRGHCSIHLYSSISPCYGKLSSNKYHGYLLNTSRLFSLFSSCIMFVS